MLKTLEGVYRNGKVGLAEVPKDVCDETRVLVTFLEPQATELQSRGIDEVRAAELRARLASLLKTGTVLKWPCMMTTMPPKPVYKHGDVIPMLFPHSDFRTAKLRPALVVPANGFQTGPPQDTVAMITGLLFRPNHPSWVVEVVTGEARVMFADDNALPSAKVTFPFFLVRADGRKYSSKGIHRDDHPKLLLRSAPEPEMIARRNWTRAWWDSRRQAFQLVTSVAVIDELQAGVFPNQDQALALLIDISLLPVEPTIIEIQKHTFSGW